MKKRLDHIRRNRIISSLLPFGGLILIFLLFLILTRGRILKPTNISNIIDQVFTTLIVSVGAVFVYAHGGFDMSVSAICGVAQLAMAALVTATDAKIHPLVVLAAGTVICVLISMLNAIVHLELKVPIFVVTLCTMFACSGLLANIAQKQIYSVPMMYLSAYNQTAVRLVTLLIVVISGWILFEKTKVGKIQKVMGGILAFLAFNIHRSTALPIVCILATFFIKDTRLILGWWITSISLSLVAGGPIEAFFTGLGFDDRMETYSSDNIDASVFSSTGFRWDFLLYSAMPIWLGYYVVIKRKIWDKNYLLLLHILCNSFWVMMIRASYSNRFAYLSWFLYALVLIYPCLKLPIWKDQGKKTALIILGHLGFTLFMYLIY